jgi:8-oxo-dGTP diphosphatase
MVRNTVRAVIIHDESILMIKKERTHVGVYYALPGGAQEPRETLDQALKRECLEELGIEITESDFMCVREYISNHHEYSFIMKEVHAMEFIYNCKFNASADKELHSSHADVGQIGITWLPVSEVIRSLLQQEALLKPYKFPAATQDFIKELLLEGTIIPYKCKVY